MAKHTSAVGVAAPPEAIFELLERDRTEFRNDELVQRERVGDLPFGPGYRFKSTVVHDGDKCEMQTVVTTWDAPRVLHEEWVHECRSAGKTLTGSQRFEAIADHAGSILKGEFVRRAPGFPSLLELLSAPLCNPARAKLAHLGMRAEALTHSRRG